MYYKTPFNFGEVMDGQDARKTNIHDSIAQHLQLLITTRFGEYRYDENYGNAVTSHESINLCHYAKYPVIDRLLKLQVGVNIQEKRSVSQMKACSRVII